MKTMFVVTQDGKPKPLGLFEQRDTALISMALTHRRLMPIGTGYPDILQFVGPDDAIITVRIHEIPVLGQPDHL